MTGANLVHGLRQAPSGPAIRLDCPADHPRQTYAPAAPILSPCRSVVSVSSVL
jgi:hypothetical protein